MVLSDKDIRKCLANGRIKVTPAPDLATQLGPCSIDLRLADTFRVFERSRAPFIDTQGARCDDLMREVVVKPEGMFIMQPGELVLASTYENLELADDLLARLEGRSSLARLGIIVHGTAGVFEPGWRGKPTLELGNLGPMPVALHPLMRICSFTFEELSSPSEVPYWKRASSKYLGQQGADPSRFYSEKDIELHYRAKSTQDGGETATDGVAKKGTKPRRKP
ncbi:MAG TPA: dCTP deaminase [Dehalococcoidia bacterium]|nr:dCTP deaminase [Dehalococcoidia bacterium]